MKFDFLVVMGYPCQVVYFMKCTYSLMHSVNQSERREEDEEEEEEGEKKRRRERRKSKRR